MKPSSSPSKAPASDFSTERRLIHEMANHLTIIQGAVRKALGTLEENPTLLKEERARLAKADDYLKKSTEALRDLRTEIHRKIGDDW